MQKKRIPLFVLLACLQFFTPAHITYAESAYVDELVDRAREMRLSEDPYWRTLVHYQESFLGTKSLVDDPEYFLSARGKYDPESELEATIRSFFRSIEKETDHPACKFVARFEWLKEKLQINPSQLPLPECRRFEEIVRDMQPERVGLIFPASHMNSPASMFGHTLLTVDTSYKNRLLDYAINYAAYTTETFGPRYAVKGLFGLYTGYFSILPYYTKLQEYSDVDLRDIWEYHLNLQPDEIRRLLMHIYEMDSISSDYYFFDENCSFLLFYLLDAARPSLRLTDRPAWWVIPMDTMKEIQKDGLIADTAYRPSKATKIKYIAALLDNEDQEAAIAMVEGGVDPEMLFKSTRDKKEMIPLFDLAGEYLQYRYSTKDIPKEKYTERLLTILKARSILGENGEDRYKVPIPPDPLGSHDSNKMSAGFGMKKNEPFYEIRYRPAYHDLLDRDVGYIEGGQIIFGGAALRYYPSDEQAQIQELNLIDIVSISPRDRFFRPISWKVRTGLYQRPGEDGADHMVYSLNPGGGFAWTQAIVGMVYGMMETDLMLGGRLDTRYALGVGGSAGILRSVGDTWKVHLYARDIYYGLGDRHNSWDVALQQSVFFTQNSSLSGEVVRRSYHHRYETEATIMLNLYF